MSEVYPFFDRALIDSHAPAGSPILLALSGGADSSAALVLLAAYCAASGRTLHAAHLDHAIRAESADDADFCASLCARFGVTLHRTRVDVPALAAVSGRGIEAEAREARYTYFARVMAEENIPVLITAHHAEDNLETMLMHLTRGSGLRGLCGIRPVRTFSGGVLLRPLLRAAKADLLGVCAAHDIAWRTDETNDDCTYTRNRIRADVLPTLAAINPALLTRAADTADALRADEEYLTAAAASIYGSLPQPDAADADRLRTQPTAMRMRLYRMLHGVHAGGAMLEQIHCTALDRLLTMQSGALSLPGEICASLEDGVIRFFPAPARPLDSPATEDFSLEAVPGWTAIPQLCAEVGLFSVQEKEQAENIIQNTPNIYKLFINRNLNFATMKGRLHWRLRRPGDRLFLRGHHRSLKKLLSAAHIPVALRDRLPILCDAEGIVFVPGVGVRDDAAGGDDIAVVRLMAERG